MARETRGERIATAAVKTRLLANGALLFVGAWLVLMPSTATAYQRPSLSWSLARTASEGVAIPFTWTGRHLGRNHRLVIQKPVGTAHTWRTIGRLPSSSGSDDLTSLPLGKYRFRIADLVGRYVLAWRVAGVAVFGQVPFSTLFGNENYNEVYATPQYSFPYVTAWEEVDKGRTAFTVAHNNCVSVHIAFVPSQFDHEGVGTGTITLVQESRESVSASAPYESIGSLDAELVPNQTWAVNASYSSNDGVGSPEIYINGYAVCDSTESFFS